MRITIRRVSVIFDTSFTDDSGDPSTPDSATLTISYPVDCWPLDGGDRTKETIDLTQDEADPTIWSGTWDSSVSNPGIIFWMTEATTGDVHSAQDEGHFRLRGNLANLTFVNA